MSGHSKWSTIKHKKGMADAKRSANFTRLAREIEVAARSKGPDPEMNFQLRLAIDRARAGNMPKDNIERAIARGSGSGGESIMVELLYEAYAPGGTALVIECITDNRNRTGNEVKLILSKGGATFADTGSVTYLFAQKGIVRAELSDQNKKDDIELALIDAGAEDITYEDNQIVITCPIAELSKMNDVATDQSLKVESAQIEWIPNMTIELDDSSAEQLAVIIEKLEESDDVTNIFTNAE